MRHGLSVAIGVALSVASGAHAADPRCGASVDRVQPRDGVVATSKVAEAVAFSYLVPIYGEAVIRRELPLRVSLSDGVWTVNGTLPPGSVGGAARILLCQRNGTVLSIIHFK